MDSDNTSPAVQVSREASIDAINQMFAEFALVYHNQYQKAFPDKEKLMYAKRLWMSHLGHYAPERILAAARQATRESEYLPTVRGVLKYLEREPGVPDVREAYREACLAPSPKAAQAWSHPVVYWAGHDSDWYFLATTPERQALPVFERHYRAWCEKQARGEPVPPVEAPLLPVDSRPAMTPEERAAALARLRQETGL